MPPVNWDQPSTGIVNDVQSALILTNHTGGALGASSDGVAISAKSSANEAVIAETTDTLTGRFTSDQFVALFGFAPNGIGVIAANQAGNAGHCQQQPHGSRRPECPAEP